MSSLEQTQEAFSHRNLENLRNGLIHGERKEGEKAQKRQSDARTSVSHHLKGESQQLQKRSQHTHKRIKAGGVIRYTPGALH